MRKTGKLPSLTSPENTSCLAVMHLYTQVSEFDLVAASCCPCIAQLRVEEREVVQRGRMACVKGG